MRDRHLQDRCLDMLSCPRSGSCRRRCDLKWHCFVCNCDLFSLVSTVLTCFFFLSICSYALFSNSCGRFLNDPPNHVWPTSLTVRTKKTKLYCICVTMPKQLQQARYSGENEAIKQGVSGFYRISQETERWVFLSWKSCWTSSHIKERVEATVRPLS